MYKRDYTPHLHDVVPNQVYEGQRVDFWFDIMDVHSEKSITPDNYDPAQKISINRVNVNWEGLVDYRTRLTRSTLGRIPARVGDATPTKDADVVTQFRSGYAYKRTTAKHCNYAGDECWYVKVLPKIESISATSGYKTGGQTLTITGKGLQGTSATTIEVDGTACEVTS